MVHVFLMLHMFALLSMFPLFPVFSFSFYCNFWFCFSNVKQHLPTRNYITSIRMRYSKYQESFLLISVPRFLWKIIKQALRIFNFNGWKPLTTITKLSILDVAAVLDPPLLIFPILFQMWKINHWCVSFFHCRA